MTDTRPMIYPATMPMHDGRPLRVPTQQETARQIAQSIRMTGILEDIGDERERQDAKHGGIDRDYPDNTCHRGDDEYEASAKRVVDAKKVVGTLTWRDILREEFYEALNASGDELEIELIQVAAVCASWIEDLRRRRERAGKRGITSGSRRNGMDILRAMVTPDQIRYAKGFDLPGPKPRRWRRPWRRGS